ncbi:sucrose phosphorylase [Rhizomicrobium electricum]|uniref:Sucrose phosphorylase n=1 Tax=Rhizomicrobium electricum TaxID=480070 RepID=A0ABP3PWB9_9PROT|nr:sucrose phosphorylase [Rhizomicrobium electricum]NIJ49750.1 sucrose phosphorylase [Rhizomicrobium electricum]
MKNKVQLIAYADRFGGQGLQGLHRLLTGPLNGVFATVHILPFFHPIDGSDAGFDPIDHTKVDSRLGRWDDIKALSADVDVMADLIVNHMSIHAPQYRDFSRYGSASPYDGLFLTKEAVFAGEPAEADLAQIYRPRPGHPFTPTTLQNGEKRTLWTTFTPQQVDIDVRHPQGVAYLDSIMRTFAANGVKAIRLDAVGYAIKRAGTNCFMIPETFDFISELTAKAHQLGMEVLVEVHSYYRQQIAIAAKVDWVYDFALPPLILHAFAASDPEPLKKWIAVRPKNALTVLDTHDGIGIIDVGAIGGTPDTHPGLLSARDIAALVDTIHDRTGGQSRKATGNAASNLDIYQINCTYFDAMGRNEAQYLMARAIQFLLPGIPQVYYVGLLAGGNDMDQLARTHIGRDINRHCYGMPEISAALARPVVQQLIELIRLRNTHPAFAGTFTLLPTTDCRLELQWMKDASFVRMAIDFETMHGELQYTAPDAAKAGDSSVKTISFGESENSRQTTSARVPT